MRINGNNTKTQKSTANAPKYPQFFDELLISKLGINAGG
jgi:hypothetical protein